MRMFRVAHNMMDLFMCVFESFPVTNVQFRLFFQIPNLLLHQSQKLPQTTPSEGGNGSNRKPALSCIHQQRLLLEATSQESIRSGEYDDEGLPNT